MFKIILNYFFFIPKIFPHIMLKKKIRPYFGIPKRNYGGPSLRTKKLIKEFGNYYFSPNIIYAQSWWTQRELCDCLNYSLKHKIPIVFNQNGWFYPAWYKNNWKKRNETIVQLHKISNKVIYQSAFCKTTSVLLNKYSKPESIILHNPPLIKEKKKKKKNKKKFFDILVSGVFGNESKHILLPALKALNYLNKNKNASNFRLQIYGVIKKDMKKALWFKEYSNLYKRLNERKIVFFNGRYNHNDINKILNSINLAIHIKYKDPCPNAVIERIKYGLPHIYSNSGGTPELIGNAGYPIEVKNNWKKMIGVDHVELAKKIILVKKNEKQLIKFAFKQSKKFNSENYIDTHKDIFKNLNK